MKSKMALHSILDTAFPPHPGENTTTNASTLPTSISPTTLLETFIPGYGPIHKFLLYTFGLDVTVVVSLLTVLWLFTRAARSLYNIISSLILNNYTSEINISSTDEIHAHLLAFLANQYKTASSRRLMAETPSKSAWELDSEDPTPEDAKNEVDENGAPRWLNFSNQEAKSQPRFTPAIGSHNFWHQGHYFQVRRKEVSLFDDMGGRGSAFKDREILTLSCLGRSTSPIKALIQHAKNHYHAGHNAKTVIKRPAPKDMRRFGGRGSWVKIAERPCRPMKTVVLDEERKMDVLRDINEYLNPKTARWYANRGIPYRRGYLFYGPPGTGKTSLTFALAGVFGLDIHVVSLLESTLTEEELGMLFTNLPARCIVLLEDIDTAGLIRNDPASDEANNTDAGYEKGGKADSEFNVQNLTKALKKANEQSEEERKKGISLSGLLNIIDGVASHEGRVLVMTTNRPEKLDEALIRPGRVDHQVPFDNATRRQVKELFERMYASDASDLPLRSKILPISPTTTAKPSNGAAKTPSSNQNETLTPPDTPTIPAHTANGYAKPPEKSAEVAEDELSEIAKEFAQKVPDDMFSPAEIQGFLLKRKTDPRRAVREVEGWVLEMVGVKKRGKKF